MNQRQLNFYGELLSNHGEEVANGYKSLVESTFYWANAPTSFQGHPNSLESRRNSARRRQFLTVSDLKERIARILKKRGQITVSIAKCYISDLSHMSSQEVESVFIQFASENNLSVKRTNRGFLKILAA